MPIPATLEASIPALCKASVSVTRTLVTISFGSCSTQPGFGKICSNSRCAVARTRALSSNTMVRELVVPWSIATTCIERSLI